MIDHKQNTLMSEINIVPFCDVMLVLLIIFMVTAPMMVQGVDIALPESRQAESLSMEEEQLTISIDKDSKILINDYEVGIDHLREKLDNIFENRSNRNVFLKADKDIAYGEVVAVMAEIKAAGVEKLGMVTRIPDEPEKIAKN
jgi:biopolymer transport protein TolR